MPAFVLQMRIGAHKVHLNGMVIQWIIRLFHNLKVCMCDAMHTCTHKCVHTHMTNCYAIGMCTCTAACASYACICHGMEWQMVVTLNAMNVQEYG